MPAHIVRLRKWLVATAILLVLAVAGTYFYGRWRVYQAMREGPRKLGLDIQQSTEGFVLSKSEGGRTLFMVRASRAVQYATGGRAELRDVLILVYGRERGRYDQIYGERFEYDPQSGNVTAVGEVNIDLEGTAESPAPPAPGQALELQNSIHLRTRGLVFNQHTGLAQTDEHIEFRTRQTSGSARGAVYDSAALALTLKSDVQFEATGPDAAAIRAHRAVITRNPTQAVLERAHIQRPTGELRADRLAAIFREDKAIEQIIGAGNVQLTSDGDSQLSVRAARAHAWITPQNLLRSALLSGGVSFRSSGKSNMNGSAGQVRLTFNPAGDLTNVVASDGVGLAQLPVEATATRQQRVDLSAPAVTFEFGDARRLRRLTTAGDSEIVIASSRDSEDKTVVTAGRFVADFDQDHRLRRVAGDSNVSIVAATAGQPDRVSTSQTAVVTLDPAGEVTELVQTGNFTYREGPGLARASNALSAPAERTAFAQQARFTVASDTLALAGAPVFIQNGTLTTAETIVLRRRTGEAIAEGSVKTTYSELRQQPGGALLATADPIHVTASRMTATQAGATAVFYGTSAARSVAPGGNARLWQGANQIQAPVIEFNRDQRTVVAHSPADLANHQRPVSTVLVQPDGSGKLMPVKLSARRLSYVDAERRIRFEGGVDIQGAGTTLEAGQINVYLQPRGQSSASASVSESGPSQIARITATGGVVVRQKGREARGEVLVYTTEDARFVLTGGSPSIFDAERGRITGDSLTFFSGDDRVLVEGTSSPTVTKTKVAN